MDEILRPIPAPSRENRIGTHENGEKTEMKKLLSFIKTLYTIIMDTMYGPESQSKNRYHE
jgi:hypothetical protein